MRRRCQLVSLATFTFFLSLGAPQFPPFSFLPVAAQTTQERKAEADRLLQQGDQQYQVNQFTAALQSWQQALMIYRAIKDRRGEGQSLGNLGAAYQLLGNNAKAIEVYQQRLAIAREIKDRGAERASLIHLADLVSFKSDAKCVEYGEQLLIIARELKDQNHERKLLLSLGSCYKNISKYAKAIEYSEKILELISASGLSESEMRQEGFFIQRKEALRILLITYKALGNTSKANEYEALYRNAGLAQKNIKIGMVEYLEEELEAARKSKDFPRQFDLLRFLFLRYHETKNYVKAVECLEKSLAISRRIRDLNRELEALIMLGRTYSFIGDYPKVIEYYEQSLKIRQEIKESPGLNPDSVDDSNTIGDLYNGLGQANSSLGNYFKAIEYYRKSWLIYRENGRQWGQIESLNYLGSAYSSLKRYEEAIDFYQQALIIQRATTNNREGEATLLASIASTLEKQNQPELAIVFYKQSVNVRESIRQDLRPLTRDLQASYTQTVEGTYRNLADLLIQQRRLSEAQAVLELLKLRELREFTRDGGINSTGISLAKVEEAALKQILAQFTTVGNFSQQLTQCQQTNCPTLGQLQQQRDTLNIAVQQEMKQQRAILAKHFATESGTLTPDKLNAEARRIVNAQPGTVLIYPLVLKDKIQFLVAFQAGNGAVTFRPFETKISAEQLFKTIQTFRNQLSDPSDLKALQATSQTLYNALIKPLEAELNNPQIKHLVFAPDSSTRYIPLAALYDGQQYLMQRFTITTITAASQTDTDTRSPIPTGQTPLLLAMGASTFPNQNPLPNVPAELDAITRTGQESDRQGIYPGSKFLNGTFDYAALQTSLQTGTYRILHLATHGAFQPGRVEESYLVPGRGQNLTTELIDQLSNYGLGSIHLVVLSACQTAVGDRASDGMEIPGISYFFLKNNVKSVLASLWNVNDASTTLLMQQFYKNLAGGMTKSEALRQAQLTLLNNKIQPKTKDDRGAVHPLKPNQPTRKDQLPPGYTHPHYWAPFILIGNGL